MRDDEIDRGWTSKTRSMDGKFGLDIVATKTAARSVGHHRRMDVLASRIILRPADLDRAQRFYRDVLGLAVYREFGNPPHRGMVFFLGAGFLEVSGTGEHEPRAANLSIWLQVRDVHAEHQRLISRGVPILQSPRLEPWGLIEMWISDPDGVSLVLVQVPDDHPLRRDSRTKND